MTEEQWADYWQNEAKCQLNKRGWTLAALAASFLLNLILLACLGW